MLVVALAGLLVNIACFFVLHGGDRESLNMRGAILHVLGDLLGSVAAIVAALVILATGWTPIDPILSVLVALLILSTAWSLMREAAHVLLEGVPPKPRPRRRSPATSSRMSTGVREVHHMHVWSLDGVKHHGDAACLPRRRRRRQHARCAPSRRGWPSSIGIAHATVEPEFGQCADDGVEPSMH